jgi:hypothetical protein
MAALAAESRYTSPTLAARSKVARARRPEIRAIAELVRSMSLRRSRASATTPATNENTTMGPTLVNPTMPRASAFRFSGTSSVTCHRMAAVRMKDPDIEMNVPTQRRRKLR